MSTNSEAPKGFTDQEKIDLFMADMKKSGLQQEILNANGVKIFTGTPEGLAAMINIETSFATHLCLNHVIVIFPYPVQEKKNQSCRVKLIPAYTCADGSQIKYMQPKGVPTRPYIIDSVWNTRKVPSIDLFIVEGEKKALLLNQEGFPTIALPGVYNFRNTGESQAEKIDLSEDLRAFTWTGRNVYIAFDADFRTNKQVRQAMFELTFRLEKHGAQVKITTWDPRDGKGIDDLIVGKIDKQETSHDK